MRHSYVSIPCTHEIHEGCTTRCYICFEYCRCSCHGEIVYDGMNWASRVILPRAVHQIGFNQQGQPVFEIRCKCGWNYIVARKTSTRGAIVRYLRKRYKEHRRFGCYPQDYSEPVVPRETP